jgi:hypothetical protein
MNDTTSAAYPRDRIIRTARLACVYCQRGIRAHDVEVIGGGLRIVCAGYHRDLIVIEKQ